VDGSTKTLIKKRRVGLFLFGHSDARNRKTKVTAKARKKRSRTKTAKAKRRQLTPEQLASKERRQAARSRARAMVSGNPLLLSRVNALSALLSVDPSTTWRWRQQKLLPEPDVVIGDVEYWSAGLVQKLIDQRRRAADA
jgi:hypothetical protein